MIKKGLFACALFLTGMANAQAGFYIGPFVAYQSITVGNDDISYQGFNPRISAGYDTYLKDSFKAAVEVFYGPKSLTMNNNSANGESVKPSYSYGASILPAYIFDDVITGYLRLGGIMTHFQDAGTTRRAYQVGGGVQLVLTDKWDARIEYDYSKYNSISGIGSPQIGQYAAGLMYHFS